jgi:hypothetical protein
MQSCAKTNGSSIGDHVWTLDELVPPLTKNQRGADFNCSATPINCVCGGMWGDSEDGDIMIEENLFDPWMVSCEKCGKKAVGKDRQSALLAWYNKNFNRVTLAGINVDE